MKVSLAVQALSRSEADAIEYCAKDLKLKAFKDSEPTVKFIRLIDRLFDVLNSRNPFGRDSKAPLRSENRNVWEPFLDEAFNYLLHLKDSAGTLTHEGPRKTGFIGFMTGIHSIKGLFKEYVDVDESPLQYLLTYKFSQDHLELFFGAMRSAGGCNDNPTVQQFIAYYKRLLLHSSIGN